MIIPNTPISETSSPPPPPPLTTAYIIKIILAAPKQTASPKTETTGNMQAQPDTTAKKVAPLDRQATASELRFFPPPLNQDDFCSMTSSLHRNCSPFMISKSNFSS
jgi:hypothetical protein